MSIKEEKEKEQGSGLFFRCIICSFILLVLFSVFALNTDFSVKIKTVFKTALTENTNEFIPKTIEAAQEKIFSSLNIAGKDKDKDLEFIPDENIDAIQEDYPNPIIMPSETQTKNGYTPYSDI